MIYFISNSFIQSCLPTQYPNMEAQEKRSLTVYLFIYLFTGYLQQSSIQNNLELCIKADYQTYLGDLVTQLYI